MVWSNVSENALLSSLVQCLENYRTEFHQTFSIDAFWDKDECANFWGQKVKSQGQSVTKGPAGGSIQSFMPGVKLLCFIPAALERMAAVADQRKRFTQIKLTFAKRLAHHLNNLFIHQVGHIVLARFVFYIGFWGLITRKSYDYLTM